MSGVAYRLVVLQAYVEPEQISNFQAGVYIRVEMDH